MVFDKNNETLSEDNIKQIQIERLQSTINRVYRNVSFYKHIFDKQQVDIGNIKTIDDITKLPFTTRNDLNESYPYGMFAVPLKDIVRIHATSGTTGRPIVVGYTKNDLYTWSTCTARLLAAAGITSHDVVQLAFHCDLNTYGFGFQQGAEMIGASVIPSSVASIEKQLIIMKDFKTTVLMSVPGYALSIASAMEEVKMHPEELFLKTGLFGFEPMNENMRKKIKEKLHIQTYDNYCLTEIIGPGIAGECEAKDGLHINEDHFIVEIIDPKTLKDIGYNKQGELVFTTITKEGFPLIRYRTGDTASLIKGKCSCGRTFLRMSKVTGRTDDLVSFEGVRFFPSQIEDILIDFYTVTPRYQIVIKRSNGKNAIELKVELSKRIPGMDELKNLENLRNAISGNIKKNIGIYIKTNLVEPSTLIKDKQGKILKVIEESV